VDVRGIGTGSEPLVFEPGKPVPIFMRVLAFVIGCAFLIISASVLYFRTELPGAWLTPWTAMKLVFGLFLGFYLVRAAIYGSPDPDKPSGPDLRDRPRN
jgi:hypothetical protein